MTFGTGLKENVLCRWREFLREPSAVLFVFIMPPIWIVILGTIFSGSGGTKYPIGIVTGSDPIAVDLLRTDPSISLHNASLDELLAAVGKGEILAAVQFRAKKATYYLDPQNKESQGAKLYIDHKIQKYHHRIDPVQVEIKPAPAKMRYIDFFVPGLLAFSVMTSSFYGVGMSIVSNRRENLLKRFLVTPMPPLSYILSHIIGRLLILMVEVTVIVLSGFLFFQFEIKGNPLSFMAFAIAGTAAFTSLSVLMGSRGRNISTFYSLINLITLPLALFSGVWFESSHLPEWLAAICSWLPLAPLAEGLRGIAVDGSSVSLFLPQLLLLFAYTVVTTLITKFIFKWY